MKNQRPLKILSILVILVLVVSLYLPQPARAASCQSNGSSGGLWSNPATWTGCSGLIPASGDTIDIQSGDTVTLDGTVALFGATLTLSGTLDLNGFGLMLDSSTLTVNASGVLEDLVGTDGVHMQSGLLSSNGVFSAALIIDGGTTTASGEVDGDLTLTDGWSELHIPASLMLEAGGNVNNNGIITGTDALSTFRYVGTGARGTFTNNGWGVYISTFEFGNGVTPLSQTLAGFAYFIDTNVATLLNGVTLTLATDPWMGAVIINSGATFNISNHILSVQAAGTPLINNGALLMTGSTVLYAGSSPQTLSPTILAYENLTIDCRFTVVTGTVGLKVTGLLELYSGTFFSASTFHDVQIDSNTEIPPGNLMLIGDATVSGNFTNYGFVTPNGYKVTFVGPGVQLLNAYSPTSFFDLTINPGAIVSETVEADNVTVSNLLTNNGTLEKTKSVSGVTSFFAYDGYGGLLIDPFQQDLGRTTVTIRGNQECTQMPNDVVKRCFDIAPTISPTIGTTLTFFYAASEIPTGQSCDAMNVYHWSGVWSSPLTLDPTYGVGGRDCSGEPYSLRVTGVTDFSPFVLKQLTPTAVELRGFAAAPGRALNLGGLVGLAALLLGGLALVGRKR